MCKNFKCSIVLKHKMIIAWIPTINIILTLILKCSLSDFSDNISDARCTEYYILSLISYIIFATALTWNFKFIYLFIIITNGLQATVKEIW